MASPSLVNDGAEVVFRAAMPEWAELERLIFSRYPAEEWATFLRVGWRETSSGLILTLAGVDAPEPGDLDDAVGHVAIQERYTLRVALDAEDHGLGVGVVHSHPSDYRPLPSHIDDEMDTYFSDYLGGFAPGRPYVSLIFSRVDGELVGSGRVYFDGRWRPVSRFVVPGGCDLWEPRGRLPLPAPRKRTARLNSAFGNEAASRLRAACVGVMGAGGTGSPAIEALARAGVGELVIVDPDSLDESNLERVHGSFPRHAEARTPKVQIAKEHVQEIDPDCKVTAIIGALPQQEVVDALARADFVLGCTDQQHGRLALSELAYRYLVPALDCGVVLEGAGGNVTGQIFQFVHLLPEAPCVLCRQMILPRRLSQELMSPEEKEQRRLAAREAAEAGEPGRNPYWDEAPQLNTVGYLTTAVGALAAGYAIGCITGRFAPPFSRLQGNLSALYWDVTDQDDQRIEGCTCGLVRGWADQAAAYAVISAPIHWDPPRLV